MMSKEFLYWEQVSRDTIDFKTIYVDIAGDIVTGLLLSQIIYWNLPNKEGKTKLRIKINNELWLAKGRTDWYEECRITPKQFDRSIKILESKNIVETKLKKFNGSPTKHLKLNFNVLISMINEIINSSEDEQRVNSNLPKGENRIYPNGKIEIDQKVISLTENTTENKTENKKTTTESVVVDKSLLLSLSKKINEKIGAKINNNTLTNLIIEKGEDTILKYIMNWDKFKCINKTNVAGFFVDCVKNEYEIPKQEKSQSNKESLENFMQREYEEDDYKKFYSNSGS